MSEFSNIQLFDPNLTQNVINATGPQASPRMRKVIGSLIQHLHDFMRENVVTMEELLTVVGLLNEAGAMSTSGRNEILLLSDILGLESLADTISSALVMSSSSASPTETAILGPFYSPNAPIRKMGDSILLSPAPGCQTARLNGFILDYSSEKPINGAVLDLWLTGPDGKYEGQEESTQAPGNLRGRFETGTDGAYEIYAIRPTAYPIPQDGPAGKLLDVLDRHAWRPAHVHFLITAPGYKSLITQVYDRECKLVTNDAVFGVKDSLVVDFTPLEGNERAQFELRYDFRLVSLSDTRSLSVTNNSETC